MARIRSIKPEFWTSDQVMNCKPITRLLFIGMWNFADDYGRLPYSASQIKARLMPNDQIELQQINEMLAELSSQGLILIYSAKGKEYIEITGWSHQKIDKRQPPKYPGPSSDDDIPETPPNPPDLPRPSPTPDRGEDRRGEDKKGDIRPVAEATRTIESQFEDFLKVYPRRSAPHPRQPAFKAFGKAVKSGVDPPALIAAARKYAEAEHKNIGTEFIPMAASWLNKRYFDQYLPSPEDEKRKRELWAQMEARGYRWIDEKWVPPGEAA